MLSQKRLISKSTSQKRRAHSKMEHRIADATSYQIGTLILFSIWVMRRRSITTAVDARVPEQILTTGSQVLTPRSAHAQHLKSKRVCESPCARNLFKYCFNSYVLVFTYTHT